VPRVVDTDAVRPQDRLDLWVEAILRACFPLTLRRRDGGREPFRASVHQYFLGPVAVSRIRAPATTLTRTSGEVRLHDPGTMVVYDTARPFRLEFDAPTEVIVVATSKAMLASSLDWARSHCAQPLVEPIVDGVAARWGLSSSAHLSRSFRVAYGCTPSDVRAETLGRARSHHLGGIDVQGRLVRPVHA
jgi:AraC-like DNA-binding protein